MTEKLLHGRKSERFKIEDPIQYVVAIDSQSSKSKATNCSQEGICFESEFNLTPGAVLFIAAEGDLRYYRAEVRWSEKLEGSDPERYTIGAEYIDPL
jgi:hypothetical protein